MRRFQKISKKVTDKISQSKVVTGGTSLVLATASQAAVTAPTFTDNIADLGIILGAMIGFGATVWGARKLLGFAG